MYRISSHGETSFTHLYTHVKLFKNWYQRIKEKQWLLVIEVSSGRTMRYQVIFEQNNIPLCCFTLELCQKEDALYISKIQRKNAECLLKNKS